MGPDVIQDPYPEQQSSVERSIIGEVDLRDRPIELKNIPPWSEGPPIFVVEILQDLRLRFLTVP